ncbi:MAG: selenide, water dikinase SelD [candidate division KSB1 bacterium]|nr:selenide, water dikinase SelD [candidate division KSB1 bacterium]
MKPIYLDYNATTPVLPAVKEAMLPFLDERFGNPSSTHPYGTTARLAVEEARRQVAELLRARPEEIYFTSGGTESNNWAIKGCAFSEGRRSGHIITSAVEHPAVLEVCDYLEQQGFRITRVPVDAYGMVDPADVEKAVRADTFLITIMHANNEVGTIQPIAEIARIAEKHGLLLHTDAAQSIGKIPVHVDELGVDLLSIAGHKLYAPKGVGALYIRRGTRLAKFMHGAGHERGQRAGTENVAAIVALGKACELAGAELEERMAKSNRQSGRLAQALLDMPGVRRNGHPQQCLPNTVSLSFYGLDANTILSALDQIAASAGAACHAADVSISHVLQAMNVPIDWARGTIRFSLGVPTTDEEIERAIDLIQSVIRQLRGEAEQEIRGEEIRLTQFTHGLGCACKMRPQLLEQVLAAMTPPRDAKVLVGLESSDDAAVYQIDSSTAIVQTVDFFTPILDDPYQFGAVAAANSLSDIYAMGGQPLFALNIVAFPSARLPLWVLQEILRGARDKADEAGVVIIGGHTIDDTEPKYGLAVTGRLNPNRIWRNIGAKPGDALVLTKPIGTGVLTTALKRRMIDAGTARTAFEVMASLNRTAAEIAAQFPVHACTDVTGFGLLGHLLEMVGGSGVSALVRSEDVPLLPAASELAAAGAIPGGTESNLAYLRDYVEFSKRLSPTLRRLLADAQTSGGLLFALDSDSAMRLAAALHRAGVSAAIIGEIIEKKGKSIYVQ